MTRDKKRALFEEILPNPVETKDIARILRCSFKCARRFIKEQKFPYYKNLDDGKILIQKKYIIDFFENSPYGL